MAHALIKNRSGLIEDACVTEANSHAERTEALAVIEKRADRPNRITLGADRGFDVEDFVNELRTSACNSTWLRRAEPLAGSDTDVTPHIAPNTARRRSGVDRCTERQRGYAVSQRVCKRIEEGFGWSKQFELLRRIRVHGRKHVDKVFTSEAAACNLIRLPKLLFEPELA